MAAYLSDWGRKERCRDDSRPWRGVAVPAELRRQWSRTGRRLDGGGGVLLAPSPPPLLPPPFLRLAAVVGRKSQLARVSSLAAARGLIGVGLGFGSCPDVEDGVDGTVAPRGHVAAIQGFSASRSESWGWSWPASGAEGGVNEAGVAGAAVERVGAERWRCPRGAAEKAERARERRKGHSVACD